MNKSPVIGQRNCFVLCMLLGLIVAGCIPAHVPDNLNDTPGPPVVVDNGIYAGVIFKAQVPEGWRVITSEAQAPQSVIFVAPDEKTLIRLIAGEVAETADLIVEGQRNQLYPITLENGVLVTVVFSSPVSSWAKYWPRLEQVRDSVSSH